MKDLTKFSKISGARFIAETLKGYEVTHVFFVSEILGMTLAEMETLGVRRVLAHSEKAAAYMADGYAKVSHRPGVCMAQSVGAANMAAGLQDAYLGLSPVIAITGRKVPISQYRNAYQEIPHGPLFDPLTKFNAIVDSIKQLPYLLRQAFREATSGTPGPVHLDVMGHLGEELEREEANLEVIIEEQFKYYPSCRPEPEIEKIRKTLQILENSGKPVIVAGGGSKASSAGPEIVKLAEMLLIPVATSLNGRGVILDNHPLSVGVVGSYSRVCANQLVSEADLVIFVGSHTGDQVTNNWKIPKMGTKVIQIDIDPLELGRNFPNEFGLWGDAKATLSKIINNLDRKKDRSHWVERAQQLVKKWRNEVQVLLNSDAVPIRPERLCKEITEFLPSDAILVSDTGYSAIWTGTMVNLNCIGQSYVRCAGSLGWAFPASLGAKCAAPDRPVICFTGDGGFWYHLSELETAVRSGIKTVTIINNNHGFAQCSTDVDNAYEKKPGNREEIWMFRNVNFAKIAQEIGCFGIRVEHPEKIGSALGMALDSDLPAVIDVVTDAGCKAPFPWAPESY
jgi:acetolactate synthase-1/2/3 large subunit